MVFEVGAMKTILFSLAMVDTAGASAEVSVPDQEVDAILDDQLAREPYRLVGAGLAVARQQFQLAAKTPPLALIS